MVAVNVLEIAEHTVNHSYYYYYYDCYDYYDYYVYYTISVIISIIIILIIIIIITNITGQLCKLRLRELRIAESRFLGNPIWS